jgi:hypothetical protein
LPHGIPKLDISLSNTLTGTAKSQTEPNLMHNKIKKTLPSKTKTQITQNKPAKEAKRKK